MQLTLLMVLPRIRSKRTLRSGYKLLYVTPLIRTDFSLQQGFYCSELMMFELRPKPLTRRHTGPFRENPKRHNIRIQLATDLHNQESAPLLSVVPCVRVSNFMYGSMVIYQATESISSHIIRRIQRSLLEFDCSL